MTLELLLRIKKILFVFSLKLFGYIQCLFVTIGAKARADSRMREIASVIRARKTEPGRQNRQPRVVLVLIVIAPIRDPAIIDRPKNNHQLIRCYYRLTKVFRYHRYIR